jgi:hypothetical protein
VRCISLHLPLRCRFFKAFTLVNLLIVTHDNAHTRGWNAGVNCGSTVYCQVAAILASGATGLVCHGGVRFPHEAHDPTVLTPGSRGVSGYSLPYIIETAPTLQPYKTLKERLISRCTSMSDWTGSSPCQ